MPIARTFTYTDSYEVEGRDLVFIEVDFGVSMASETGDNLGSSAVAGLEIARQTMMAWGSTIIAEGPLYSTNQKKAYLLSGPAGLATAAGFEDNTTSGSLENVLRAAYTAAAAQSKTTANWGTCVVTVKNFTFA